ncbi:MAG: type IV pilus biogenesis protein PilM [Terriglobales bacterium]
MVFGRNKRPRLACELTATRVAVARATDGTIDSTAVRMLPPGVVNPHLVTANIANRDVTRTAISEAMAVVGGRRRDVIVVLPDGACRVVLLDFDMLPDKRDDAEAVVRFRLKKSLPFDVEKARVSYDPQPTAEGKLSVVAAVTLNSVLEEYESVLREAGYTPGMVIPSMLASLGQVDGNVPTLVIKIDPVTTSFAIVDNGRLLLVRTLDNPGGVAPEGAQLAEDVYPSLVFFQDTYGTKVQKILVGGLDSLDGLNASLAEMVGLRAQELVSTAVMGPNAGPQRALLGAVVGALLA